ncbi:MAG: glycoside hydrolase family 3 N-terminal domain-containing protein [Vicinamibacteria bacterium]
MKRRLLASLAVGGVLLSSLAFAADSPVYKDAARPVDERVRDLLSRMSLEEKVAQTYSFWKEKAKITENEGAFSPTKAEAVMPHGVGQLARPSELRDSPTKILLGPRENAIFVNSVQKWLMEKTRLGIPAITHEEALHGLTAPKGTSFPIPIALASSWDPSLLERVMSVAALEARARGTHEVLSPVLDLARDPRWGRTEESYGEDPYLVSRLGVAAIVGYQGRSEVLGPDKVLATAKHFAGHGQNEGGINTAPGNFPERTLRDQYLFPFEVALRETPVMAVMPSYNEIDGVPSHKSRFLLDRLLRQEWGFKGMVTSDYYAIDQMVDRHHVATDYADAAIQAMEAGVDIELPDPKTNVTLIESVKSGRISEGTLDRAVARLLRVKFLAGLFENPYVDPDRAASVSNTPAHQAVALDAARRALVLLKNDKSVLPLDRSKLKSIAVIGPNAKGVRLGGYSSLPGRGVDILQGITDKAGTGVRVLYSEGVRITEHEPNWTADSVTFGDPVKNRQRIKEAVAVAKQADLSILVIGTNESTSREAWADNHLGDVADLRLSSQQDELFEAVTALGKPVVVVLINGRPLAIPRIAEAASAILEGFYLGQEGGTALAEVIFGDYNPGGKLPITFPRDVGQLPVYYGRKPTSFRSYLDAPRGPLFAFGFGLSYTTFAVENLTLSQDKIGPGGHITATVEVANTGSRAGDEVVQLYVHDRVSSVTRPVQELRGFERVTLAAGERRKVVFTIGPEALQFTDEQMNRVVEPGLFDIMVGSSLKPSQTRTLEVVAR